MQSSKEAKYHGGSEYAKFIFKKSIEFGYQFDIIIYKNRFLDSEILDLIKINKIKTYKINNKVEIYNIINSENYDVFYSALPYEYYDYKGNAKLKGVIHGLRAIELPWEVYKHKYYSSKFKRIIGFLVSKSKLIQKKIFERNKKQLGQLLSIKNSQFFTVSQHSKYSLINFFPFLKSSSIEVFYSPMELGTQKLFKKERAEQYFLLVSGNRFEKNTFRAIQAFDELFYNNQLKNYKVIITGARNLPFKKEIKNKENFILLPYVNQEELNSLYNNAYCFVYPSLNEGFGYPPLIAMNANVPVIASTATSIPEVCGDAALFFSPDNISDLKNRILQITDDNTIREQLIQKGYKRVEYIQNKQSKDLHNLLKFIFDY